VQARWIWVVSFTLRSLYSKERAAGTYRIGSWVGPEVVLDAVDKIRVYETEDLQISRWNFVCKLISLHIGCLCFVYVHVCACALAYLKIGMSDKENMRRTKMFVQEGLSDNYTGVFFRRMRGGPCWLPPLCQWAQGFLQPASSDPMSYATTSRLLIRLLLHSTINPHPALTFQPSCFPGITLAACFITVSVNMQEFTVAKPMQCCWLTWYRIFSENLTRILLVKKFPAFVVPRGPSPCWLKPASGPSTGLAEPNPQLYTPFLLDVY
jgi:hypothetical protein